MFEFVGVVLLIAIVGAVLTAFAAVAALLLGAFKLLVALVVLPFKILGAVIVLPFKLGWVLLKVAGVVVVGLIAAVLIGPAALAIGAAVLIPLAIVAALVWLCVSAVAAIA
jgi:hypothetical protein